MSDEQVDDTAELSIDDLFADEVDRAAVDKANEDLLMKAGTWTTIPAWRMKVIDDPKDLDSVTGKPRRVVFMSGKASLEGEKDQNISYRMSSHRRNAVDFDTKAASDKPDSTHKRFLEAEKAYKVATGRDSVNIGEIASYLRDFPHKLRVTQFMGRNLVVNISAVPPVVQDA